MYTSREVTNVLGLSAGRLRSYLRTGFVAPIRGDDGELRFSFQDLVLLRKAEGLVADRIPPRRVHHVLRMLRERLPDVPLSGVHLAAEGTAIVARDGRVRWQPDSGQTVFDFGRPEEGAVVELTRARPSVSAEEAEARMSAHELYERACAVEEADPGQAQQLYRRALTKEAGLADAHVNLGRLLHESGEVHAALVHYRSALKVRPGDPTASFNIGVALEDLGSQQEAIDAYQKSIACEPGNADAHYNLARLLEQLGKPEMAIRHLLIYRQLTRRK